MEIHEFNNEQTDIKINDFQFHLILKMPYHAQTNYMLIHEGKLEIEKVEFKSKGESKVMAPHDSYCTTDCQLI